MVSSLTRTSRMGYTKDRMRLLKPQAPTCEDQALSLGSPTTGRKPDSLGGSRNHTPCRKPALPSAVRVSRGPSASPTWAAPGRRSCPDCSCTPWPRRTRPPGGCGSGYESRSRWTAGGRCRAPCARGAGFPPPGAAGSGGSGTVRRCTARSVDGPGMSLGPGGCPYFTAFPSPYPYYPRGQMCDPFPLRASVSPCEQWECCLE